MPVLSMFIYLHFKLLQLNLISRPSLLIGQWRVAMTASIQPGTLKHSVCDVLSDSVHPDIPSEKVHPECNTL